MTGPHTPPLRTPAGGRAPRGRPPIEWFPILLEAFFVVLGVVLALAANEWREAAARRARAATALAGIGEEIASNRAALAEALAYHQARVDAIRAFAATDPGDAVPGWEMFPKGYVSPAPLLSTAWETAASTGATSEMEYELVLEISRLYELQERYETQVRGVGQVIYQAMLSEGSEGMRSRYTDLGSLIYIFVFREIQLLESIDQTLERLSGRVPPAPADEAAPPG